MKSDTQIVDSTSNISSSSNFSSPSREVIAREEVYVAFAESQAFPSSRISVNKNTSCGRVGHALGITSGSCLLCQPRSPPSSSSEVDATLIVITSCHIARSPRFSIRTQRPEALGGYSLKVSRHVTVSEVFASTVLSPHRQTRRSCYNVVFAKPHGRNVFTATPFTIQVHFGRCWDRFTLAEPARWNLPLSSSSSPVAKLRELEYSTRPPISETIRFFCAGIKMPPILIIVAVAGLAAQWLTGSFPEFIGQTSDKFSGRNSWLALDREAHLT